MTTSCNQSHILFVYLCKDTNLKSMLDNSMFSKLTKKCNSCKSDTKRHATIEIEQPPTTQLL